MKHKKPRLYYHQICRNCLNRLPLVRADVLLSVPYCEGDVCCYCGDESATSFTRDLSKNPGDCCCRGVHDVRAAQSQARSLRRGVIEWRQLNKLDNSVPAYLQEDIEWNGHL